LPVCSDQTSQTGMSGLLIYSVPGALQRGIEAGCYHYSQTVQNPRAIAQRTIDFLCLCGIALLF
jgi:hypothetical protein